MPCAYVYIIRCRGGSLYTGIARSVCRRLRQHTEKSPACAKYTRSHPVEALKRLPREKKLLLLREPERLGALLPTLAAEEYTHQPGVSLEMCLEGQYDER